MNVSDAPVKVLKRLKGNDEDRSIKARKKNEGVSQNFEKSLIVREGGDIYILQMESVCPPPISAFSSSLLWGSQMLV